MAINQGFGAGVTGFVGDGAWIGEMSETESMVSVRSDPEPELGLFLNQDIKLLLFFLT